MLSRVAWHLLPDLRSAGEADQEKTAKTDLGDTHYFQRQLLWKKEGMQTF